MYRLSSIRTFFLLIALIGFTSACGESKTEEQRMSDAQVAFESGKYRAALIELKNLLQENPKSKDGRVLLARTSLKIGDPDSAEKELERALRLGATDAEIYALQQTAWLKLTKYQELVDNYGVGKASGNDERAEMQLVYAKALNGLDQKAAATREFQSLIDSGASSEWRAEGLVGLALIARASGDDESGKAYAEQALEADAKSASAYITIGQIALARNEFESAHTTFVAGQSIELLNEDQKFVLVSGELESALGKGSIEGAKDAANRLFALAPEHPITNYLLARVAYISGDKEMAHERTQKVLSKFPEFMPAQFLQGALSMEREEFPQAEMFLSNVVAAQPSNFEARKMLAEANMRLGNATEAAKTLREGIEIGAGVSELSSMLGRINLRLDNSAENTTLLEKALDSNPTDERARLSLVASYIASGRADEAQALMEQANGDGEAITPERKAIVKLIAAMQADDRQGAISQADIILSTWPNNARTHNMIGGWFATQGLNVKARTTLEASYAKHPNDALLLTTLARLDHTEDKMDQAVARFEEYFSRVSDNPEPWLALVSLYVFDEQEDKAIELLQRARKAMPDEYLPAVVYSRLLLTRKKYEEALQIAEQTATLHEDVAIAQFMYGRGLFETNQYDLALEYLKKANLLQEGNPEVLAYKGRAEARMKRFAQARKSYQSLWDINPGNLEAAQAIALIELRGGNTEAANKMLDELRELRPDDPRVDIVDADIKAERGNNKAAFTLYEQAYSQRPSRDLALKLARLAESQGESSASYIRRWLSQTPNDVAARLVLAQNLQQNQNSGEAITEYEAIVAARPDDWLVLNNLAWLYFEEGTGNSRVRALELAKRAYDQNSNNPQIADTYGWILFRSGEVVKGRDILALAEAGARDRGLPDARDIAYHYAAALNETGDRSGARLRLKSILDDKTPFYSREDAQRLLESLAR